MKRTRTIIRSRKKHRAERTANKSEKPKSQFTAFARAARHMARGRESLRSNA